MTKTKTKISHKNKNKSLLPNDSSSAASDDMLEQALKLAEMANRIKEIDQKISKITHFLTAILNENSDRKKTVYLSIVFVDQTKREKNKEKAEVAKFLQSPEEILTKQLTPPTKEDPQIDEEGYEIYEEDLSEQFLAMMEQKGGVPFPFFPFAIQAKRMIKKDSNVDYVDVLELPEKEMVESVLYVLAKLRNEKNRLIDGMKRMATFSPNSQNVVA